MVDGVGVEGTRALRACPCSESEETGSGPASSEDVRRLTEWALSSNLESGKRIGSMSFFISDFVFSAALLFARSGNPTVPRRFEVVCSVHTLQ